MRKFFLAVLLLFSFVQANEYSKGYMSYKKGLRLLKTDEKRAYGYFKKSLKLLKAAHHEGSIPASYILGRLYCNGWGVKQDFIKAEAYFKENIKQGGIRSHCCLAKLYLVMDRKENSDIAGEQHLQIAKRNHDTGCDKVEALLIEKNESHQKTEN